MVNEDHFLRYFSTAIAINEIKVFCYDHIPFIDRILPQGTVRNSGKVIRLDLVDVEGLMFTFLKESDYFLRKVFID